MDITDNELAGRIEGVSRAVLLLIAALEDARIVRGPYFSDSLRQAIQPSEKSPAHLGVAQKTLQEMADALDKARYRRRSFVDRP